MDESRSWMAEPIAATVHLAFAFDIGDSVDLDRARLILQGQPGQLPRRSALRNRSVTARPRSAWTWTRKELPCRENHPWIDRRRPS